MAKRLSCGIVLVAIAAALVGASVAHAASSQPRRHAAALSSLELGVLGDINAFRAAHHLARLRVSAPLTNAAREHSQQMAAQGYFAHESGDGSSFGKRLERFYPAGPGYWSVGENLLWSSPDVAPAQALRLWLASPEHRANLITARWREIGVSAVHVAAAPGAFRGMDVTIVTTDFGVRH